MYMYIGSIVGQALTDNMKVRKIGFTGSTDVGKGIMQRSDWQIRRSFEQPFMFCCSCAVSNAKRVSLELGGKSPLIIFGDCDMDKAVRQVELVIMQEFSNKF